MGLTGPPGVGKSTLTSALARALRDRGRTVGVGAGQMSRVDSSKIAVWKAAEAGLDLKGSAIASDALFPFADGLQAAIDEAYDAGLLGPNAAGSGW